MPRNVLTVFDDNAQAWAYQQELEHQQWEEAMKIHDMMPSKYLKKEDVGKGVLVTVKSLSRANVAMEGEPVEHKYLLHFNELEKPLVMNSTNIQLCAQALDSEDTDHWIGKQLVLYTDPNVSFGGKITGGVRIRAPRTTAVPPPVPVAPIAKPDFDDDIPW
jgi:hypothetical protein